MAFGPRAAPAAYRCQNHPDREGVGICVRCRRVICAECSTRIDRMNFCTTCLATLGSGPRSRSRPSGQAVGNTANGIFLLLAGYLALTALFVGLGLLIATMRPGL
jgi:hypothetical protein